MRAQLHRNPASMNTKVRLLGAALALIALTPGVASASFILDTGTPDGSTGTFVLSSSSWLAAEFTTTSTETITSLAAYLTEGVGQPGDTFTFDVDASANFLGTRTSSRTVIESITSTYTANGWNATTTDFTLAAGTYWLALQVATPANTKGLDAPGEPSASNGTAPAGAFAYAGTSGEFSEVGAPAVGLQITGNAAPVPLPTPLWLLGSGLALGLGASVRRRRGGAVG
jgi:hypothetical protein